MPEKMPERDAVSIKECPNCGSRNYLYKTSNMKPICWPCCRGERKTDVFMVEHRFLRSTPARERAGEMRDLLNDFWNYYGDKRKGIGELVERLGNLIETIEAEEKEEV